MSFKFDAELDRLFKFDAELDRLADEIRATAPRDMSWAVVNNASPERHLDHPIRLQDIGHLDDIGNAQRLVSLFGENIRFCVERNSWTYFDGKRWRFDGAQIILEGLAKQTARSLFADAACCDRDGDARAIAKFASASASAARIQAMIAMARSEPDMSIRLDEFDRDPMLLNCENGTIDLKTGQRRKHDRADFITKLSPVKYDPDADAPQFKRFLNRTFENNERVIGFMQRLAGYMLTGSVDERVMLIAHGPGANGKTVLQETLGAMLGDYAATASASTFMSNQRDNAPRNDLAALRGIRLVKTSETGEGKRLDEPTVKLITGGDEITARFLYGEFFTYTPAFKVLLATNHKPEVRGTDLAIWDRIVLIPFTARIPEGERDPKLKDKLRAELPGILAWAVRGCLAWQEQGLNPPDEVRHATGEYRAEQDHMGEFIEDCCTVADGLSAGATPLFECYLDWCKASGVEPLSQTAFGSRMTDRGFKADRCKVTRRRIRRGIGLLTEGVSQ